MWWIHIIRQWILLSRRYEDILHILLIYVDTAYVSDSYKCQNSTILNLNWSNWIFTLKLRKSETSKRSNCNHCSHHRHAITDRPLHPSNTSSLWHLHGTSCTMCEPIPCLKTGGHSVVLYISVCGFKPVCTQRPYEWIRETKGIAIFYKNKTSAVHYN